MYTCILNSAQSIGKRNNPTYHNRFCPGDLLNNSNSPIKKKEYLSHLVSLLLKYLVICMIYSCI